jgi:V8-like Glu-specific endopeptidase
VFGSDRFDSLDNYRRGLERCASVARIGRTPETGLGTGFVISGRLLCDALPEAFVLVTNAHVVSENEAERAAGAVHPEEAVITFAAMDDVGPDETHGLKKVLFSSPRDQLDVAIAELAQPVKPKIEFPIAPVLPIRTSRSQVRVIGHPSGRGLSFSINTLLDHEPPKIHYRTATEGGSSGSPVFNAEWKLIGLHHAGGEAMTKLNGESGTYEANEGIWIKAIREAVAEKFR